MSSWLFFHVYTTAGAVMWLGVVCLTRYRMSFKWYIYHTRILRAVYRKMVVGWGTKYSVGHSYSARPITTLLFHLILLVLSTYLTSLQRQATWLLVWVHVWVSFECSIPSAAELINLRKASFIPSRQLMTTWIDSEYSVLPLWSRREINYADFAAPASSI